MIQSRAVCSAGVSATSQAEPAGMTMKHITVHPNAQVAQSVEQRTENPRVGSSILSLGTNSLLLLPLNSTRRQLQCLRVSVASHIGGKKTQTNLPLYSLHPICHSSANCMRRDFLDVVRTEYLHLGLIGETSHIFQERSIIRRIGK